LERQGGSLYSPVLSFGKTDMSIIDANLGKPPYLINQACIKKYSACTFAHTSIDALGLIMKENKLRYQDIEYVETALSELGHLAVGTHPEPGDLQQARFSVEYLLAEVMLRGAITISTFTDSAALTDPARVAAKAKVRVKKHPDFVYQSPAAEITVLASNGKRYVKRLESWLGSPEYPLSTEQIRAVCRPYLEHMLPSSACDRIEELVLGLDKQPDILELMDILTYTRVGRRS
jgi:2-methylcitrate dehydratase PrpD